MVRAARRGVVAAVCLGITFAGCGGESDRPATTATLPGGAVDTSGVELTVAVLAISSNANQTARLESGAFDGTPYRVKWVEFEGSNAAMEALNAGAVDVGFELQSTITVLAQGNAKPTWTAETAAFTIVDALLPPPEGNQLVVVHPDSPIQSVADLQGKKVTYARGSLQHYFWAVAAEQAGLDLDEVELVELPAAEGRAAFQSGAVDAMLTSTRQVRPLLRDGTARVIAESTDLAQYRVHIVRRGVLDDPARAAAVSDLFDRAEAAEQWKVAHPEEVAALHERIALLSPEDAAFAARESVSTRVPLDDVVVAELQRQADVFFAEEVIAEQIDVALLFDRRFFVGAGP